VVSARLVGWNQNDYDVVEGVIVGRIFNAAASPVGTPLDADTQGLRLPHFGETLMVTAKHE